MADTIDPETRAKLIRARLESEAMFTPMWRNDIIRCLKCGAITEWVDRDSGAIYRRRRCPRCNTYYAVPPIDRPPLR